MLAGVSLLETEVMKVVYVKQIWEAGIHQHETGIIALINVQHLQTRCIRLPLPFMTPLVTESRQLLHSCAA